MKGTVRTAISLVLAASVASCTGEASLPLSYNEEMVTSSGNYLISDDNEIYEISDTVLEDGRYYACFFIMNRKIGNVPEIRLESAERALSKDVLKRSKATEDEMGEDPIYIENIWTSGKYMNMRNGHLHPRTAGIPHKVNLVFDDLRSNADTLYFLLCHNACGEKEETYSSYFTSFPFDEFIPSGKSECVITIEWKWLSGQTDHRTTDMSLSQVYHISD